MREGDGKNNGSPNGPWETLERTMSLRRVNKWTPISFPNSQCIYSQSYWPYSPEQKRSVKHQRVADSDSNASALATLAAIVEEDVGAPPAKQAQKIQPGAGASIHSSLVRAVWPGKETTRIR